MLKVSDNSCNNLFNRIPTFYRGALIAGIPLLAILPAIASWSWSRQAKSDAFWWVNHTQEVIRESNNLMRVLVDAETGIRGYTITQQSDFLKPYYRGIEEADRYLHELKDLTQDNPSQQQQLAKIEREIDARLKTFKLVFADLQATPTSEDTDSNNELFVRGKAEMDRVRKSVNLFKEAEWRLLNIRQQRLKRIRHLTDILFVVSVLISLLGYGLAISLYYQSQKKLQRQVRQLDNANHELQNSNLLIQKRNHELDKFTYIVSHDLKAPLRAINNLSEWIEEDSVGKLDEDSSQNMALLRSRVKRMNNFIDSLLEYSRAGRIKGKIETVDVGKLLVEIVDSISPPPEFTIDVREPMPIIETDALSLQQVLSNLISNGVKHHHRDDGRVVISVENKSGIYQFCVADNGRGICLKDREKVFTIFQTLTSRDRQENTGIGLSIVKKIIEERGDKIWLESEVNEGASFYFTWQP